MRLISIAEYRSLWKEEFELLAAEIRGVVGKRVIRIDHIGSTAIPGLAAKDVIDIQLTVAELDSESATPALTSAGYRLNPENRHDLLTGLDPESPELQKKFVREPTGIRHAHIHIRQEGRINQAYPLLFRDYLRADPVASEAYCSVKKELASRFGEDPNAYYAIKDPYMDTIYQAAKLWAQVNQWKVDNEFM
ncbi:MAG: GrpB family protein [Myxococcales bacterium]